MSKKTRSQHTTQIMCLQGAQKIRKVKKCSKHFEQQFLDFVEHFLTIFVLLAVGFIVK